LDSKSEATWDQSSFQTGKSSIRTKQTKNFDEQSGYDISEIDDNIKRCNELLSQVKALEEQNKIKDKTISSMSLAIETLSSKKTPNPPTMKDCTS
jgi:hypothetical protein